ncbi:MAG: hypothetical protein HN576_01805 [Bacteriovoracaceae bacterium]|nr:hypothetical protein [Bacteriovoracaceae bacterium]
MKSFIISIISLFQFQVFASMPDTANCKSNKAYIKGKLENIKTFAEERDVEALAKATLATMKWSCPKEYKKAKRMIIPLIVKGRDNHIAFMMEEARKVAAYRSPAFELAEIARVKKFDPASGKDTMTASEKSKLIRQGKANSKTKAKSCTSIDNRKPPLVTVDKKGKILSNKTRSQDSIGWCYAFAAADILSHEIGKKISAVDVANAYNTGSWDDMWDEHESDMTGGFIASALEAAQKRGLCLESQMPSEDHSFANKKLKNAILELEKFYKDYAVTLKDPTKGTKKIFAGIKCTEATSAWKAIFPKLNAGKIVMAIGKSSSANVYIDNLIKKMCNPRLKPKKIVTVEADDMFTSVDSLMTSMDASLAKGKIIGLSYTANMLNDVYDESTSNHASLVVARKFNAKTGSCEYLIRNSWGTGCSYDPRLGCEEGNIWMPEEYMRRSIRGITYVTN